MVARQPQAARLAELVLYPITSFFAWPWILEFVQHPLLQHSSHSLSPFFETPCFIFPRFENDRKLRICTTMGSKLFALHQ